MRAAVIERAGHPPRLAEREPPRPGTVAIAVSAAPITPLDRLCAWTRPARGRVVLVP